MGRAVFVSLFLVLLAGCETTAMSEKECLAGDWYAAGFEDGALGLRETNFDARAAACYEYDVSADLADYREGRADGLFELCTPQGGYGHGLAGRSYLGVCLAEDEPGFLGAYLEGWRVNRAQAERARAESAYDSAVFTVESYHNDIRRAQRTLRDDEATDKEINKARKRLKTARSSLPYAEQRADELLYELGRADEMLEQTMRSLPAWRRSAEFAGARDALLEAQGLARGEDGIDYCTDEDARPQCEIGGKVRDKRTGALCAQGPAKAVMARRAEAYGPYSEAAFIGVYQVFAYDDRGRTGAAPSGQFVAMYDEKGAYMGAACPSPYDPPAAP